MLPKNLIQETFLYPTDTTFGLGCNAFDKELVQKINTLKQRPNNKNFILLVHSQAQLMDLVEVPEMAWQIIELAEKPITIVYDTPITVPNFLLSNNNTIAIRLTHNKLCKKIIQQLKSPIISTSANISTEKPPTKFENISKKIIQNIDYIFPECKTFVPKYKNSSIIKVQSNGVIEVIRT